MLWSKNKIGGRNDEHETFYYEKLDQARYQDCYHKALIYTLGISEDTRNHFSQIYDIKSGYIKPGMQRQSKIAFHQGWQTSGSVRVVRLAFNLYTDGTPSVDDYESRDEQIHHGNMDNSVHRTWKSKGQLSHVLKT